MPYAREFHAVSDLAYLRRKGKFAVVEKIEAALDAGKKVEWVSSSFDDPGTDWNRIEIAGEVVYKEGGC